MSSKISTNNKDYITCPFCGYEDEDSWEVSDDSVNKIIECASCGKEFILTEIEDLRTFSTIKPPCKGEHNFIRKMSFLSDSEAGVEFVLPIKSWTWFESFLCSECEEEKYKRSDPTLLQIKDHINKLKGGD